MEPHRNFTREGHTVLTVSWSDQILGLAILQYPQAFALVETLEAGQLSVGTRVRATLSSRGRIIATILPASRPIRVTVEAVGMTRAEADDLIEILQRFGQSLRCADGKS